MHDRQVKDITGRLFSSVIVTICTVIGFFFKEAYGEQQRRLQILEALAAERGATIARVTERADSCRESIGQLELSSRDSGRTLTYLYESVKELKECCRDTRKER